jgi:hypothetical protein
LTRSRKCFRLKISNIDCSSFFPVRDCDPADGPPCSETEHIDSSADIFATPQECCQMIPWLDADVCVSDSESIPSYTNTFYVSHFDMKCGQDCDSAQGLPCMGRRPASSPVQYDSASACCSEELSWIVLNDCITDTYGI